jgi:energy-converting hydrogenase Eha subunit E
LISQPHVLRVQGAYYLLTGLWPLVHLASFEAVAGPKVDDWLVHMVGLLAAVIGAALIVAARREHRTPDIMVLAVGSASAFTAVDVWYTFRGQIAPIYLADAVVEMGLFVLLLWTRARPEPRVQCQAGASNPGGSYRGSWTTPTEEETPPPKIP